MTLPKGRIVKGPSHDTAKALDPGARESAPGRLLKSVLAEASQKAKGELVLAERRAAAILAEAEERARSICAEAKQEGQRSGAAEVAAAWIKLRTEEAARDERDLGRTIELARAMAERLLGEALELAPDKVLSIAKQTLAFARQARRIVIKAHPSDADALRNDIVALGLEGVALEIHADSDRTRGSLLLDTDLGTLDANVTIQLDRLARSLRDGLQT